MKETSGSITQSSFFDSSHLNSLSCKMKFDVVSLFTFTALLACFGIKPIKGGIIELLKEFRFKNIDADSPWFQRDNLKGLDGSGETTIRKNKDFRHYFSYKLAGSGDVVNIAMNNDGQKQRNGGHHLKWSSDELMVDNEYFGNDWNNPTTESPGYEGKGRYSGEGEISNPILSRARVPNAKYIFDGSY